MKLASKMHLVWPIFSNFTIIRNLCAKKKRAVSKWDYTKVCFTINDPLKMLLCHFWIDFGQIFKALLKFYCPNGNVATLDIKIISLLIFFEISNKIRFLWSALVNWWMMAYLIFFFNKFLFLFSIIFNNFFLQ